MHACCLACALLIEPRRTWTSLPTLVDLEEVTDTVGTARVMAAPRTPTKFEREESADGDGDRPRVSMTDLYEMNNSAVE